MSIIAPKPIAKVQVEAGTYIARCYSMIHIGTLGYEWQGEKVLTNKISITFELPTEMREFGDKKEMKPIVLSQEYGLSLGKKSKLRPLLESWRGKVFTDEELENFDVSKLVGVPAFISVIHNEKGYAEIASISKLPKGTECPPQINKSQVLEYDNWNQELFDKLPEFIKKKITSTPEYRKLKGLQEPMPEPDESLDPNSIPF